MPQDAQQTATVRINTDLIPPWTADDLANCLLNNVRSFFSIPENQAKLEQWADERDRRRSLEGGE